MSGQCRVVKANFDVVYPTLRELETPNIVDTCLEAANTQECRWKISTALWVLESIVADLVTSRLLSS
jgi:hypothetical protein